MMQDIVKKILEEVFTLSDWLGYLIEIMQDIQVKINKLKGVS